MIKDYYKILGLSHTATDSAIKSAYRELALKYHPDRNKSSGAHEHFVEINEAYQVLSDPRKKEDYDYRYTRYIINKEPQAEASAYSNPTYTYSQQREYNRQYYYQRRQEEVAEDDHEGIQKIIQRSSWITLLISVFLLTDFFLPRQVSWEHLISSNIPFQYFSEDHVFVKRIPKLESYDIIRTENYFVFYKDVPANMLIGDPVVIVSSRILDIPIKVFHENEDILTKIPTQYGLYDMYVFYIIMFLLSAFSIYAVKKKKSTTEKLIFMWFGNILVVVWILIFTFIYYNLK